MSTELSPQERVWPLLRGFMSTQALFVVASLGIPDELAEGPLPLDELAHRTGADADTLGRFLRTLASEGVFAEEPRGTFRNTPESELLRSGGGEAWREFTLFFGSLGYRAFGEALHAAKTGDEPFSRVFGVDFWNRLAEHPAESANFNRAMQAGAEERVERLAGLAWRDGETVVDVGGGNGTLLIELIRRKPGLKGIVFDLPEVAQEAKGRVTEAGLEDKIRVAAGSMFDGVPEEGDAYVLAVVLHDWNDEAAAKILHQLRETMPDESRLVILDAILESESEDDNRRWLDLLMLVLNGGRERTEQDWNELLGDAGFRVERFGENLIEAVPA